jgi:hypothetical protein
MSKQAFSSFGLNNIKGNFLFKKFQNNYLSLVYIYFLFSSQRALLPLLFSSPLSLTPLTSSLTPLTSSFTPSLLPPVSSPSPFSRNLCLPLFLSSVPFSLLSSSPLSPLNLFSGSVSPFLSRPLISFF